MQFLRNWVLEMIERPSKVDPNIPWVIIANEHFMSNPSTNNWGVTKSDHSATGVKEMGNLGG